MSESHFLEFDDYQLHYEIQGKGFPVLCLSGFGCSNYNFEFIREALSKTHQLILVDNRGMGESSKVSNEYTIDDLADDALSIMESLGHQKFVVFGISMGGFIAQKVALKASKKVVRLILACTTSSGDAFPKLNKLSEENIRQSFSLDPIVYNKLVMNATVHPSLSVRDPEREEEILKLRLDNMPELSQVLLQQKAVDHFLDDDIHLESLTMPTLILTGDEDRFVDPVSSTVLSKKIRNSRLRFIEESDHHFFLEKPFETARAVKEYMEPIYEY